MIDHNRNFIFVHIPRTGGSSIKKKLSEDKIIGDQHRFLYLTIPPRIGDCSCDKTCSCKQPRPAILNQLIRPVEEYFKFTFVRNPWDMLVSHYFHLKRVKVKRRRERKWDRKKRTSPMVRTRNKKWEMTFKDFILERKNYSFKSTLSVHPQLDWIVDENQNIGVDFIGRFETLQEDFNYVCEKLEIPKFTKRGGPRLPHRKKSPHRAYWKYYDNEMKEVVADWYQKDIEYFGYKFGKQTNE